MNFDEVNKIYSFMSKSVYPNINTIWKNKSESLPDIDAYLDCLDGSDNYNLIATPYLVNTEKFLVRYKKNCIAAYNTPFPEDGLLLMIHQFDKYLHSLSRLVCWIENMKCQHYISVVLYHHNLDDATKFIDNNYDLAQTGNTEDKQGGINSPLFRNIN